MRIFSWASNPRVLAAWNKQCRTTNTHGFVIYTLNGHEHRDDGPAVIQPDGTSYWYNHGAKHREDGPATIIPAQDPSLPDHLEWWFNGRRHRGNGLPAVECSNGNLYWFVHGQPHREDGPAFTGRGHQSKWWYKGVNVDVDSQKEFEQWIKITGKI